MDHETAEAYVDAAAAALGLPLDPDHRPGVVSHFMLAAAMADLVAAQGLRLDDEAAPVFVPIEPGEGLAGADKKRAR
jgi:hypothetical protein